jgi:hypothetical protein
MTFLLALAIAGLRSDKEPPGPLQLRGRGVTAVSLSVTPTADGSTAALSCNVSQRHLDEVKSAFVHTYGRQLGAFTKTGFTVSVGGPKVQAGLSLDLTWAVAGGAVDSIDFGSSDGRGAIDVFLRVKKRLDYKRMESDGWKRMPSNSQLRRYEKHVEPGKRLWLAILESLDGPKSHTFFRIVDVMFETTSPTSKGVVR